jgi:hypothetical protein
MCLTRVPRQQISALIRSHSVSSAPRHPVSGPTLHFKYIPHRFLEIL